MTEPDKKAQQAARAAIDAARISSKLQTQQGEQLRQIIDDVGSLANEAAKLHAQIVLATAAYERLDYLIARASNGIEQHQAHASESVALAWRAVAQAQGLALQARGAVDQAAHDNPGNAHMDPLLAQLGSAINAFEQALVQALEMTLQPIARS